MPLAPLKGASKFITETKRDTNSTNPHGETIIFFYWALETINYATLLNDPVKSWS